MKNFIIKCEKCNKKFEFKGKISHSCNDNFYYDNFIPEIKTKSQLKKIFKDNWFTLEKIGNTPLKSIDLSKYISNKNLFAKYEFLNNTGSFKDRETEIVINIAIAQKIKDVAIISSGNAAISASAFCQKAKIKCTSFIPEKTSKSKIKMLQNFNSKVTKISGTFEDVYRSVIDNKKNLYHLSAGQNPFRELGSAEISNEIFNQLNEVPKKIIIPAGNGSLLSGIYQGFLNLKKKRKIEQMPELIAVQIKDASPLKKALQSNKDYEIVNNPANSIAESIVASESYCSPKAIKAIKNTNGLVVEVKDEEILKWKKIIEEELKLFLEPSSISVFSAIKKIRFTKDEKIVIILTGIDRTKENYEKFF